MKTLLRVLCLFCLGCAAARPALAQNADSQDLYDALRARYLNEQTNTAANMDTRRDGYLGQIKDNASFWWSVWDKHQPYSKGIDYSFRPVETEIPTQPGLTSNSPFGRDVTDLVYGKHDQAPGRSAAAALDESSGNILEDEAHYGEGSSDDADHPLTKRDGKPIQSNDVKNMLPLQ
jgi:hypothetical protein